MPTNHDSGDQVVPEMPAPPAPPAPPPSPKQVTEQPKVSASVQDPADTVSALRSPQEALEDLVEVTDALEQQCQRLMSREECAHYYDLGNQLLHAWSQLALSYPEGEQAVIDGHKRNVELVCFRLDMRIKSLDALRRNALSAAQAPRRHSKPLQVELTYHNVYGRSR